MIALKKIDEATAAIIAKNCIASGDRVTITAQLDYKTEYLPLKKVLEALGGKWKGGKVQAVIFPFDIEAQLAACVESGTYVDRKKALGFFETPADIAAEIVALARIKDYMDALEPSAGHGAILKAIIDDCPTAEIVGVEIDHQNREKIVERFPSLKYSVTEECFLNWSANTGSTYDRVVMNPPFSTVPNADIKHVRAAYDLLRPGGKLVAIMSSHFTFAQGKVETDFRDWLGDQRARTTKLPEGAFLESGTGVKAVVVVIDK